VQDEKGLFYYPVLGNKKLKMYVRLTPEEVEFRPFDFDDPSLWDEHGWVPYSAILEAKKFNIPAHLYDIEIAIRLLKDAIEDQE